MKPTSSIDRQTRMAAVVFADLVGFSKKSVPDQLAAKEALTSVLQRLVSPYPRESRVVLDTGDGAALGPLKVVYWNLDRPADAEAAFGKIAVIGLATNNLAVKFLFRPGGTDFWADTKISGAYPIWLRQLARQTAAARACLRVIGHTSRTGSEQINERLSLRRAEVIKQRLLTEVRDTATRIETAGVGSRENLIGSGTDDQRDALDRRVEFRVVQCPGGAG
jgi:outer membrane protein OmpA-like peptidoglycan-associated protein